MSHAVRRSWNLLLNMPLLTVVLVLCLDSFSQAQSKWVSLVALSVPDQVELILRLADDDFKVRQDTASELLGQGIESWDWLYRAQFSNDREIARSASRLLRQIPFEQELARLVPALANYQSANYSSRARMIIRLGQSPGMNEQMALALLTRFEFDEVLSRYAAIELITGPQRPSSQLAGELVSSSRVGSEWLRIHTDTAANFQDFVKLWQPAMSRLATDHLAWKQPCATRRLLQWYAEQLNTRGEDELLAWTIEKIVENLDEHSLEVIETFDWLLLHRQFEGCDRVVERFQDLLEFDNRFVYRRAELSRERGDETKANEIAATVLIDTGSNNHLMRLQAAINLQMSGLHHWAAIEFRNLVEDQNTECSIRVQACSLLAEIQFQEMQFEIASKTLETAIAQRQESTDATVTLLNDELMTRFYYFSHLAAVESGDWKMAETHLLDGLQDSPGHSDLLIAMLRFGGSDPGQSSVKQWRETATELIEISLQQRANRIAELRVGYDRDARQTRLRIEGLVNELNAYAWLASQTGVALETAESFSREAVELSPGNGPILDTLAACLFARAKPGEAVVYQRQAVREAPWSRQIRGGLVRYRQAMMLAEMQGLFR